MRIQDELNGLGISISHTTIATVLRSSVSRRRERDDQAAGARDAVLDRLHHGSVDRFVYAEVVTVDDQHPCVRCETQQLTRQSIHPGQLCPTAGVLVAPVNPAITPKWTAP